MKLVFSPLRRRRAAHQGTGEGELAATPILDWEHPQVLRLASEARRENTGTDRGLLVTAHRLIAARVRSVYAMNDTQPVSSPSLYQRPRTSCGVGELHGIILRYVSLAHTGVYNFVMKYYVSHALFLAVILPLLGGCGLVDSVAEKKKYGVPSEVMEPTIKAGSHITVTHIGGRYVPKLGDIILFETPENWDDKGVRVSRVIGVPGVAVECCDGKGRMTLNGYPLEESYIKELPASRLAFGPVVVPEGRVWVQGDNRHVSLDSRSHFLDPSKKQEDAMIPVSSVIAIVDLAAVE
ncbi:signal peptidase I [Streptosporangium sp. NPDC006930]|uniref:signal peptidase I n=1 Tax=Streptosporangium sp. NPDC006930 TaxID=3154783 RepID=UPI003421AE13